MKNNKILMTAAILAIGCLVIVIISGQAVGKTRKDLNQERYSRMVVEEKLEKTLLKVKSLENELTNTQNQVQSVQAIAEQERIANSNLRIELEKMTKLKGVLEDQLKNALVQPAPPPAGK